MPAAELRNIHQEADAFVRGHDNIASRTRFSSHNEVQTDKECAASHPRCRLMSVSYISLVYNNMYSVTNRAPLTESHEIPDATDVDYPPHNIARAPVTNVNNRSCNQCPASHTLKPDPATIYAPAVETDN